MQPSQNIGWPIEEFFKTLKCDPFEILARNKVKLKIGHLLNAISSFIVLEEDSVNHFL